MGNCDKDGFNVTLMGVEILYLPPRSTTKHQLLDFGHIANAKIRYRSMLLSAASEVLERNCEAIQNL